MTGSTALRIPIDEDSARVIAVARRAGTKQRRGPMPPIEQQQSDEAAERIFQAQEMAAQAVRDKVNAEVAQALSCTWKA